MIEFKDGVCVFTLSAPQAQWVCVAGDFNGWSPTHTPMQQVSPGQWQVSLRLPPGDYRFRYVTSHRGWLTDWAAFGVERNPFGEWNSIVHVPASIPAPPAIAPAVAAPSAQPIAAPTVSAGPRPATSGFPRLRALARSA